MIDNAGQLQGYCFGLHVKSNSFIFVCCCVQLRCSCRFSQNSSLALTLQLFSRRTIICRLGQLIRHISGEFKVSSVNRSAEQLTLDDVSRMGDLMVIHRMEIRKAKEPASNRSRKHPNFCFLLSEPKGLHALTFGRGRLSTDFRTCGKLSFGDSRCIGQYFSLPST
jgi:hypothetical protein